MFSLLFFSFSTFPTLVCYSVAVLFCCVFFLLLPVHHHSKANGIACCIWSVAKDADDDDDVINCVFIWIFFGPILAMHRENERDRARKTSAAHRFSTVRSFHFISNPFQIHFFPNSSNNIPFTIFLWIWITNSFEGEEEEEDEKIFLMYRVYKCLLLLWWSSSERWPIKIWFGFIVVCRACVRVAAAFSFFAFFFFFFLFLFAYE